MSFRGEILLSFTVFTETERLVCIRLFAVCVFCELFVLVFYPFCLFIKGVASIFLFVVSGDIRKFEIFIQIFSLYVFSLERPFFL